jgi:siderophore synthetase component
MALERNVAAIIRHNPMRMTGPDEGLVPATAFSVSAPGSEKPLLVDILSSGGDDSLATTRTFFRQYAERLLTGVLTLYLKYGIALEAHQQNIFALLRSDDKIIRFVARDLGGIRIHRPSVEKHGYHLVLHPDLLTVREDRAAVRKKLLTPVYHYHLGEIAATLGSYYGCGNRPFWHDLADVTDGIFTTLREQMEPIHWYTEREAILNTDWELKATLRMRLDDADGECYTPCANPLKCGHQAG